MENSKIMEDANIIDLLFQRSEKAIDQMSEKYEKLIYHVCHNILGNDEDVLECINDTYLGAWNAIPPNKPDPLRSYLCKIARNIALKRYRSSTAMKRNSNLNTSMSELDECISSLSVEDIYSAKELGMEISQFLSTLNQENRIIFMRRYWFHDSMKDIATLMGKTENHITVKLSRIRNRLKDHLLKEGFTI